MKGAPFHAQFGRSVRVKVTGGIAQRAEIPCYQTSGGDIVKMKACAATLVSVATCDQLPLFPFLTLVHFEEVGIAIDVGLESPNYI
jgi:hypothetical protein